MSEGEANKPVEAKAEGEAAPSGGGGQRSRNRQPREKTCYNCGQVSDSCGRTEGVRSFTVGSTFNSSECYHQVGHIARDCQNPRLEGDDRQVINKARAQYRRCFNCGRMGHISADCTKPAGNKACYNCGQEGHIAKECPNPKAD